MKHIYLVDFNQPHPISDGGLIAVIAESDTECHEILLNEGLWYEEHTGLIMQAVVRAQKFSLADDYESGVLEAFIA
jgi:hypothetical protein